MILIYPPIAKPCEPPAGIARLCGTLEDHGKACAVLDANLEGLLDMLHHGPSPTKADRWTTRALRHRIDNVNTLRARSTYSIIDRYKRAVVDLNRAFEKCAAARCGSVSLGLGNYHHEALSPTRSADLIRAAETPEENPFYPYFRKRFLGLMEQEEHDIVGFSLNFLSQALCTFAMIGFVKREYPGTAIVLGGGLVTSWMRRPGWNNPFAGLVDRLVAGPGERSLLSMLGVSSSNSRYHTPCYGSFPDNYLAPGRVLPYSASSGCYWNKCAFCPEKAEGNPYLPISAPDAVTELAGLAGDMKPALVHILDNAISPKLMKAIIENSPGAPWYGFVRVTSHLADPDFCLGLKRSGCVMLKLGIESGSQNVLDKEQKGIDLATASKALRNLKKVGIASYVYLLFGTPSETHIEAGKTLDFTARHSNEIDFLNLAIFNLPNHGPDIHRLDVKKPYDGDLSLYSGFVHPRGWDREVVRQYLDKEFRRHPAISPILANDPPIFTSNHAPFFCKRSTQ